MEEPKPINVNRTLDDYDQFYYDLFEKINEIKRMMNQNEIETHHCYGIERLKHEPYSFSCKDIKCPFASVIPSKYGCIFYLVNFDLSMLQYKLEKYLNKSKEWCR